jgi:hypothetical protein
MRLCLAFVVVALVAGCNGEAGDLKPAGKVKIEGKTEGPEHRLIRLQAVGVPEGASIRWQVTPSDGVDLATTARERLEFVGDPGAYEVTLTVVDKANPNASFDQARVKVNVGGRFGVLDDNRRRDSK